MKTARADGEAPGERERLAASITGTPAGTVQLGAGTHGVDQELVKHNVVSRVREESLPDVSPHAGQRQEYQDKAAHRHGGDRSVTLFDQNACIVSVCGGQLQITACVRCLKLVCFLRCNSAHFNPLSQVSFESIALCALLECN
ncbi:hypothetical protein BaRGS_00018751 [Batillaria attramentaria]|uniref:Uncharacterized protein n=1 Tax=Batillaria attramentaria TaxID=370345 RepID=A0ABD0KSL2_9CAEN